MSIRDIHMNMMNELTITFEMTHVILKYRNDIVLTWFDSISRKGVLLVCFVNDVVVGISLG